MRHIYEYESFDSELNEATERVAGGIPVFNENNPNFEPEFEVKPKMVISTIQDLLSKVESGDYDEVSVVADIPQSGKNAPEYVKEIVAKERERMKEKEYKLYGSRIERPEMEPGLEYPESGTWDAASLEKEALKYRNRADFKKFSPIAYKTAEEMKILDQVCRGMVDNEKTIFIDSDYKVIGIAKEGGEDIVLGIPRSFVTRVERDSSLQIKYTTKITVPQIIEIEYVPA